MGFADEADRRRAAGAHAAVTAHGGEPPQRHRRLPCRPSAPTPAVETARHR